MKGRALLLGSATGGLEGVANDVRGMARWLGELGLSLDVREGPDATRDGMLDGLARLVRDARRGEPAVVYYSGHGGFSAVAPEAQALSGARFAPRAFQYLVPTDHDKHRSFRGIFRAELSSLVRELSERTANITVILDCCHSTDMVRDDLVPKGVVEPWTEGIEAHVAWLAEQGYDLDRLPELRNASLVLVSACAVMQRAFEYTRASDRARCGLFTDRLLQAVGQAPDPARVTWGALLRRVVDRVERSRLPQRPQVSGPSSRYLFSESCQQWTGALTLRHDGDQWCLSGGEAAGVLRGDRFAIVDPLAEDPAEMLAEVVVARTEGHLAVVTIADGDPDVLEPGTMAVPRPGGPVHQRCRIDGDGALAAELRRRLAEVPGLEVTDVAEAKTLAFVLDVRDQDVHVLDADGKRLRWPWSDAPRLDAKLRRERFDALVDELHSLARATDLLTLARRSLPSDHPSLSHSLEWGRVDEGFPRPLPFHGAELTVGDRVYVSVENTGDRAIYVSLLDVGVGRAIMLFNRNEPEGVDLASGDTERFGLPEFRSLLGIELIWPDDVPPDGPRQESLVVFVSNDPLPVRSWETWSQHDRPGRRDVELRSHRSRGPRYTVRHVSFLLHPRK